MKQVKKGGFTLVVIAIIGILIGIVRPAASDNDTTVYNRQRILDDDWWSQTAEQGFGSAHPGTFNTVLADGSSHAFSFTMDNTTWWASTMRADGQVVDHSNF